MFNIPKPPADELITKMLDLLLNQDDPERAFVKFADGDKLVLMVNNQGGMSALEMGAIVDEVLTQLGTPLLYGTQCSRLMTEAKSIIPVRVFSGPFMGSMNMPGFSLHLTNISNISSRTDLSTDRIVELIDAPHRTPAWPANAGLYPLPANLAKRTREERFTEVDEEKKAPPPEGPKILVPKEKITESMKVASDDVIALEPKLTEWDTVSASALSVIVA